MAHTQTGATVGTAMSRVQWLTEHPDVSSYLTREGVDPAAATPAQYLDAIWQLGYITQIPAGTELQDGHLVAQTPNWFLRNPWIFPVLGITAGAAATLFAPSPAAAGAGTGAGSSAGVGAGIGGLGSSDAGVGAGIGGGLGSSGTTGSTIGNVLKYGIGPGLQAATSIYGINTAANASEQAAQLSFKAAEDALAFQKQQAAQDQANYIASQQANYRQWLAQQERLAPYQEAGAGATALMSQGLGLPNVSLPAPPPPPQYTNIYGSPTGTPSGSTIGSQTGTGAPTAPPPAASTPALSSDPAQAAAEKQAIAAMQQAGVTPSGPGTGIGDYQYWAKQALADSGGWDQTWTDRLIGRAKGQGQAPSASPRGSTIGAMTFAPTPNASGYVPVPMPSYQIPSWVGA